MTLGLTVFLSGETVSFCTENLKRGDSCVCEGGGGEKGNLGPRTDHSLLLFVSLFEKILLLVPMCVSSLSFCTQRCYNMMDSTTRDVESVVFLPEKSIESLCLTTKQTGPLLPLCTRLRL